MAMNLPSLKATRTKYRNILSKEIENGQLLTQSEEDSDGYLNRVRKCLSRLRSFSEKLEKAKNQLLAALGESEQQQIEDIVDEDCQLDSDVIDCCCDLEAIETNLSKEDEEIHKGTDFEQMFKIQREMQNQMKMMMITQHQQIEQHKQDLEHQHKLQKLKEKEQSTAVKLPKLDIPSFNRDKLHWLPFWDSFECTIHSNKKLSNIEKFNYLNNKLTGTAKSAISRLTLSNDNYMNAVALLRERFGDTQTVIDMHYSELIRLPIASNTSNSLRTLLDSAEKHLRSLEALHQNIDQSVFVSMITSKLPKEVLMQLEVQKGTKNKWSVPRLRDLLNDYVVARERAEQQSQEKTESDEHSNENTKLRNRFVSGGLTPSKLPKHTENASNRSTAEALIAGFRPSQTQRTYTKVCRYCSQTHWSDECPQYKTVEARKAKIKGSCFICLKQGHISSDCRLNIVCVHCGERNVHHRSLCPKKIPVRSAFKENSHVAEEITQKNEEMPAKEHILISSGEMVLMQTASTEVKNPNNENTIDTRILLDSGSQRTYISESLANKLSLKYGAIQEITLATFGSERPKVIKTPTTDIDIKLKNGQFMQISANIVPSITSSIQRRPVSTMNQDTINYLFKDFELADTIPKTVETSSVDILIGNDYYLDIILSQKFEVQPGLYFLGSKLGWILSGRTSDTDCCGTESNFLILSYGTDINGKSSLFSHVDKSLPRKPDLEDFWNLETIGIKEESMTNDDETMQQFKETVKYKNGRYEVKWPWKDEFPNLLPNRQVAVGRLNTLVKRLKDKPDMMKSYDTVLQEQLKLGVIEKVTNTMTDGIKHYIPHHAVIKPTSSTTKIRLLYDASAKAPKGNSLNECLYRGPVLLRDMCGLLMRFRLHKIALVSDIEKAFLQIGLQASDRNATRFLWLRDCTVPDLSSANIQEYRFCRVPFGVISSPFLLGATIEHHLSGYKNKSSDIIKNDMYMDNVITGTDCIDDAVKMYNESKAMFLDASMNLRDWVSNSKEVMDRIPQNDRLECEKMNVLGLEWNIARDIMSLKKAEILTTNSNITKREVLKQIASVYDPLGLFAPIMLGGKLFLQQLWTKNVKWDENISYEDQKTWTNIKTQLKEIPNCPFKRYIGLDGNVTFQILCFCDASKAAYSASVYLHQSNGHECRADLLFAKTRLTPTKGMTIPRLELMAVLIGSRCIKYVKEQLQLDISGAHLWTDSQCVLKWLTCVKKMTGFVTNRIEEIRTNEITFHYIQSKENPADIATRGTTLEKLKFHNLWWHGPEWLLKSTRNWPENDNVSMKEQTENDIESEMKASQSIPEATLLSTGHEATDSECIAPFEIDIERFSSITRLLRVTALVVKFVNKLRRKCCNNSLTSDTIEDAEKLWISHVQKKHFPEVLNAIKNQKPNNMTKQLGVYMDEYGSLRCKGRLDNADFREAARHPLLLPKQDRFTHLVIDHVHKKSLHAGASQTLSQIRYKYWIPHGRAIVKTILKKCTVCKRHEGGPYSLPNMPPLPKQRVTKSTPFSHTGLDYLGPLFIKTASEFKKVWVCMFTCMVTRAIHLELIQDMTADEFLMGLRRFIAQRGKPHEIVSDNATQFKLANETLNQIWGRVIKHEDVLSYVSNMRIKWSFIVQLAPWMGGFYERLVGLVKRALRKTLGRISLTNEQLQTLLTEVQAVVNSRPLVYVDGDIESRITLTPNHFMVLNPQTGIPQVDQEDKDYMPNQSSADKLFQIWKKGQKHLNKFWKIWCDEYLLSLRERYQTNIKSGKIQSTNTAKVGDVVLVKEHLPRGCWRLGRIVQLIVSRDGAVRSAKIALPSRKVIGRPLNLLFPVECPEDDGDQTLEQLNQTGAPEVQSLKQTKIKRKAAVEACEKIKTMID